MNKRKNHSVLHLCPANCQSRFLLDIRVKMPWRRLLHNLMHNEEIIRRLSESYPIRRAAQLTAYFYNLGRDKFLEQRGKYERAGGWERTKRVMRNDLNDMPKIGKEYFSNLFRPYTDTWENLKNARRQAEEEEEERRRAAARKTSNSTTSSTTTANKKRRS